MKVKIVNTRYAVFFVAHEICDKRGVFGWCNMDERAIYVDQSLDVARQRETLWHEILHCMHTEYKFPERQGEEKTVTWIAKAIADFVVANKKFVREFLC